KILIPGDSQRKYSRAVSIKIRTDTTGRLIKNILTKSIKAI
ncbi:unnamed protein product, partial [marine sediment metagenome]